MASEWEKVLIVAGDTASRQNLLELLSSAGYEVSATAAAAEGYEVVRNVGVDLLVLEADVSDLGCCQVLTEIKGSSATATTRVILLAAGGADERSRGLDLGADDVLSRPWDPTELLARVRVQLRTKRATEELRQKTRLAEEGQEIAHNAFQALAVTEKMTRDAFSLDRMLKIGVTALFLIAAVIVGVYFLFTRRAEKETKRAYAFIEQLERRAVKQQDLVAESRRLREEMGRAGTPEQKRQLEKQSEELRAKIAAGDSGQVAQLRQQLDETSARLRRIEDESRMAQDIIRSYAGSICLLHVTVAFRDKESRRHLHYAGINPQGEPLQDSEGKTLYTLEGRGPEVREDIFGTGFLVSSVGRILTNRHVAEPWWKNEELESVAQQGLEPVIAEIRAYFPDSPRVYRVEVQKVSPDTDLALMQGDLGDLQRPALELDGNKGAAISGQPLISVGYATGLAAILARAGEEAVNTIIAATGGNPNQVMAELAKRNLIRPLATQGHIGDVLPDKIVYDAQTTSGGSGGPLFNHHGKVIGVTFAVVKGFGGSNFGIPIRYATLLLQ